MSRKDAIVLAARTLAVLLTVWALTDVSYLPDRLYSFLYYLNQQPTSSASTLHWRNDYLIALGFLVVRIVGYSLIARWSKAVTKLRNSCCPLRFGTRAFRAYLQGTLG
jgi:hypothetical protein